MPIQKSEKVRDDPLIEAHWRSQAARRQRIIKFMLIALLGVLLLLVALWFWMTQPLFWSAAGHSQIVVDPIRLQTHVQKLALESAPRDATHTENLDRVAKYINQEFTRSGATVSEQPYFVEGKTYRNVIAHLGPETNERIVVGAHYDTAGPLPGADDNASGVAGLIELAQLLGKQKLPVTVELVAFTLEEPPYFRTAQMGSAVHASSLRKQGVRVRTMLSLEMIGYFSDVENSQHFPADIFRALYPSKGNFIAVVGTLGSGLLVRRVKAAMKNSSTLPVYSINAPSFIPGVDFSDQLSYWNEGFDALMITDTAFYRNPNYHGERDTPEKLDYKRMAMVVEGVYAAVLAISGR